MISLATHEKLKAAVISGTEDDVCELLTRERISDIHGYFCAESPKHLAVCNNCEALLSEPLQQKNSSMLRLLLGHGAYPSDEICAVGFQYNHTRSASLKMAVQTKTIDDVRRLLDEGCFDVNWHPKFCVHRQNSFLEVCAECDTPLMAAVRRQDVARMRLLIRRGASFLEEVPGEFDFGVRGSPCLRKTAPLLAVFSVRKNGFMELFDSDVIKELTFFNFLIQFS